MGGTTQVTTFNGLISKYFVIIPDIQRDYAQGRKDPEIKRIRQELIRNIVDSIINNSELVLNFIYGQVKDGKFIPIDGQQRLTTLFLVHLFIAQITNNYNALDLLKKFKYETRETSSRFCSNVCEKNSWNIKSETIISKQIKDFSWYTGAFESDPTVRSMLVVLDEINTQFKEMEDEKYKNDKLFSSDCPVKFLWLDLDKFDSNATEDLYVKMNARGKQLTDFEIFKGKLQKSEILNLYASKHICKEDKVDTKKINQKVIECIGKINNEISEFFYDFSKQKNEKNPLIQYDQFLMKFFSEIIKYEYFISLQDSEISLANKENRKEIIEFSNKTISELWECIEKENLRENTIEKAFGIINKVIENFNLHDLEISIYSKDIPNKKFFDEQILVNTLESSYALNTYRYLMYVYLFYNSEINNNYLLFKRFIYNIISNSGTIFAKNPDTSFRIIHFILQNMSLGNNILSEISKVSNSFSIPSIDIQFKEEVLKANLILSSVEWKNLIWEAEEYFSDGQLDFLFELSNTDLETYNVDSFANYLRLTKSIFEKDKSLIVSDVLFYKALLLMEDNTETKTSYLHKVDQAKSYSLGIENFKESLSASNEQEKRIIVFNLIREIANKVDTQQINPDKINSILEDIIDENKAQFSDINEQWKNYFICENSLFYSDWWKNSQRNIFFKNSELVFLLKQKRTSSENFDLKTYAFAFKKGLADDLDWPTTDKMKESNEFLRYVSVNPKLRIAFDYEATGTSGWVLSERRRSWKSITEDELNELI